MRDLVAALFEPRGTVRPDSAIGAELELIPIRSGSKRRVGIDSDIEGTGTAEIIRTAALDRNWRETTDAYGAPTWDVTHGGRISYEPGGQIEISSPVFDSASAMKPFLRDIVEPLRRSATESGIELLAIGLDPYNAIDDVSVQLHAPRYDTMAQHFNRIGRSGIRMMRQTASLQINVELGPRPFERWRLLNSLAPYLIAAFANSRIYNGQDTGHASHRALLWQQLDPSRTGLPYDATHPVSAYVQFAERATRILDEDGAHLTTLFPEVRPRGYFELRSIDSVELDRAQQAIELVSGLIQSDRATRSALDLLGEPDPTLLYTAATVGRADAAIDMRIRELEQLAGVAISR